MPIYKPSELLEFLESLGIGPKKGLSQNFLIDGNILRKIVLAAEVAPGDTVLEIGPGPGSLTEVLLASGAHVVAVEKDEVLARALHRLNTENRLEVYCSDIMGFPVADKLGQMQQGKRAKVIANLPYHLTTPIIAMLAPMRELFSSLTVMVQDEVAARFTAAPGTADYSAFTVFLNFYSNPAYAFKVSRNCFFPPPRVDSAVVRLDLKDPPFLPDTNAFFTMTRKAFQQRRKMLKVSLKPLYPAHEVMEALSHIGSHALARPEELSLQQFVELFKRLQVLAS